ncbi:histidine phosphatase superfamily [Apodospora peruviana]|uniref:Histidine phosphatase superfamily n=1 Tax=Apodospora peruviana TaxID=516989 RepID=A0AAE0M1H0_9PEZI|nr:histidine phosphatase superfamily [Apodospora peruviana]
MAATTPRKFKFTATTGFFEHDNDRPTTVPPVEVITSPGLGLIDRSYKTDETLDPERNKHTQWERFVHYLNHLNTGGGGKVVYKLIYAARHGEGYHNVKEAEVGTIAWESYWAKLDGDGKTVWADANLTPTGTRQALAMNCFWQNAAQSLRIPLPRRHYASPLTRCLGTCKLAFSGLSLPPTSGIETPAFRPVIKEMARERLGIHTCDRRRTRTEICESHPEFTVEDGFAENDELWKPDVRETLAEHVVRVEALLADLFANDDETIISVTAHSGTILALYAAIGHPEVRLAPGTIFPVLVRGEVV